jgi:hypothetical protein
MNRWEALAEIVRSFNSLGAVWLAFGAVVATVGLPILGLLALTYLTLE